MGRCPIGEKQRSWKHWLKRLAVVDGERQIILAQSARRALCNGCSALTGLAGRTLVKEPSNIEQKAYRDTWGRGLDRRVWGLGDFDRQKLAGWRAKLFTAQRELFLGPALTT
jgi:hypothetical protein